jgi:hypothetical protein
VTCRRASGTFIRAVACAVLAAFSSSCVVRRVAVEPLPAHVPVLVKTPVKAHLNDGSTVVYENGVSVERDALVGPGLRHDPTLRRSEPVERVPLTSVAAMETFRYRTKEGETAVFTALAVAGAVVGGAILSVAIFGSCPTVYSDDRGSPVLEAETFSYSIAPLLEGRDLDRLRARADEQGRVRLEVRNEALETHYLNHLQLLEVEHGPDETVFPDQRGQPVVLSDLRPADGVRDRTGREVGGLVSAADGLTYATPPGMIAGAESGDLEDWLELAVPVPEGAQSVALAFRARNSLLNTVLFYDVMLARAGARSLDWLGSDLGRITEAVELGRWVRSRLGLRVLTWREGALQEVARLPDPGPIAWHDVAVVVPVVPGERVARVRLQFAVDSWRIDQLQVAGVRPALARSVPVADVLGSTGASDADALASLRDPDERYLQTTPGQRFFPVFEIGREPEKGKRTLLLSSQGYYTEWVRGRWLSAASDTSFVPSDRALFDALRLWRGKRTTLEAMFERSRVPVQ